MFDLRLNMRYVDPTNAKVLIQTIEKNPGCCDTVWFNTLYGYPEVSTHCQEAEKINQVAEMFRKSGIAVSLQISNTLGHGAYMAAKDCSGLVYEGSNAENMVGPDGTMASYCFCYYGENFRRYLIESIKPYMKIKPQTVWTDDDLRPTNHSPVKIGCYCDDCIRRFNNTYHTNFSREELVHEINFGDLIWRERYIRQIRQGMEEITALICRTVLEESPESSMGREYGRFLNYLGEDENCVFEAMHTVTGRNVKARPGGGFYNDKNPLEMLDKAMGINYQNSLIPSYVTQNYAEIESTPDVTFGKSIEGTCKEGTLYLAYGCTGLTFATMNNGEEYDTYNERMLSMYAKYRPYWDKLVQYSAETKCGGVAIYSSVNSYKRKLKSGDPDFAWMNLPGIFDVAQMRIGLPLSYDKSSTQVWLLLEDMVDGLDDVDIEELLRKPVLATGQAAMKLIERGYGRQLGVSVVKEDNIRGKREIFTDHPVNHGIVDDYCVESYFAYHGNRGVCMLTGSRDGVEPLGYIVEDKTQKNLGIANAIIRVQDLEGNVTSRWAIFGYCFRDIVGAKKRDQILRAVDLICDNQLPAILKTAEQVVVIPRVDEAGRTCSVSLQNCSIGTTGELELVVRNPRGTDFTIMTVKGARAPMDVRCERDGYVLMLPPIGAWDMLTVFC